MVKLQDGSLVPASQLIGGEGEDDEGNQLKFKQTRTATVPTYTAESDLNDGTGRKKVYVFDLFDTPVRVDVRVVEPETEVTASEQQEEPKPEQEGNNKPKTEAKVVTTAVKSNSAIGGKKG